MVRLMYRDGCGHLLYSQWLSIRELHGILALHKRVDSRGWLIVRHFCFVHWQRSSDALQKEVLGTLLGDICWDAGAWESYGSHQSLFVQLTTARDQSRVTNKSLHTWRISVKRSLWFAAYRESAKAVQRFHSSWSFNKPVLSVLRWLTFNCSFTLWDLMRPQQESEPSWITQSDWCLLQNCLSHMRKIHTRW